MGSYLSYPELLFHLSHHLTQKCPCGGYSSLSAVVLQVFQEPIIFYKFSLKVELNFPVLYSCPILMVKGQGYFRSWQEH